MKTVVLRCLIFVFAIAGGCSARADCPASVYELMERLCPGLSSKITVEIEPCDTADYFELRPTDGGPMIVGSDAVSASAGLHHYLKYFAHCPVSWDDMTVELPDRLLEVTTPVRRWTKQRRRYYLNYCTYSYSMAFWDEERWQREIDWMALHGINMPLAAAGSEAVWQGVLRRLGYSDEAIGRFIAGPAYQAWWLMNNLEGWGGPVSQAHIDRQAELQRANLRRMRHMGMEPVLVGYSGMLPHDAAAALHLNVSDPGLWLGYVRPSFLQPSDSSFASIADLYYQELTRLYGPARYYSADPFHEGGNTEGVDLAAAGRAILGAMRRSSSEAVWVAQGWQDNPRREILEALPQGSIAVLDLQAENKPQWRNHDDAFAGHPWLYCMLLNFGGNVGLFGKISAMTEGFDRARRESASLDGIGLTMEGIGNNPVMYELMCELPWVEGKLDPEEWIRDYVRCRYDSDDPALQKAWNLLDRSVYDSPADSVQQGTTESLFCARPSVNPRDVSSWANSRRYYNGNDVVEAARLLNGVAASHISNGHFFFDLIDVTRQAVAEIGRKKLSSISEAAQRGDSAAYRRLGDEFIELIMIQDSLLDLHPDFRLDTWLQAARAGGSTDGEKALAERNARTQITVWGHREAADRGGLHDYAHREWSGLLRDFYAPRWRRWFDTRLSDWAHRDCVQVDWYAFEEPWTRATGGYDSAPRATDAIASEINRLLCRALALISC